MFYKWKKHYKGVEYMNLEKSYGNEGNIVENAKNKIILNLKGELNEFN
jgi:hypothetical protein